MKKHILILTLLISVFASCKKDDNFNADTQAAKDETDIQAYLKANPSINATKDANGIYYQVITAGTGTNPTSANTVTVNYTGKLLNGSQFDAGTGFSANLAGGVIKGWTLGIPHGKVGGRLLLIIPSVLAYGNTSPGAAIPKNSVLVFTIDILGIK
ncbi:MAG: FKBP-type peptidyl-prolyl cis-trans isomerase [Mucilaginibacter sp.]|jgi:FKBP-type peptidyl-prolyl cis-trans isomerase|uniref:FKBP-type peptidyl-prolyl cis-trans isomerase n=1 Tax=Mucilaginibacter sp. TaxID=1882438 RepID=UPI003563784B